MVQWVRLPAPNAGARGSIPGRGTRSRKHAATKTRRRLNKYILFFFKLINLFIYGCAGSQFLCEGPLQLRRAGATPHRCARASHCCGLSRCGAQAPDAQAQQLWLTGPIAPRHVGSSRTRARTHVPCIGRQTLNHCSTREAHIFFFFLKRI